MTLKVFWWREDRHSISGSTSAYLMVLDTEMSMAPRMEYSGGSVYQLLQDGFQEITPATAYNLGMPV